MEIGSNYKIRAEMEVEVAGRGRGTVELLQSACQGIEQNNAL